MKKNMKKKILKISAIAFACTCLNGCLLQLMNSKQCLETDWHDKGYQDALVGLDSKNFDRFLNDCMIEHIDKSAYEKGRKKGAEMYCSADPENRLKRAFNDGFNRIERNDVCDQTSIGQEYKTAYKHGATLHNLSEQSKWFDEQISSMKILSKNKTYSKLTFFGDLINDMNSIKQNIDSYADDVKKRAYSEDIEAIDFKQRAMALPDWSKYKMCIDLQEKFFSADGKIKSLKTDIAADSKCIKKNQSNGGDKELLRTCTKSLNSHKQELKEFETCYKLAEKDLKSGIIPSECAGW